MKITSTQSLLALLVLLASIVGVVLMNRLADERSVAKTKTEAVNDVQLNQKAPEAQAINLSPDTP